MSEEQIHSLLQSPPTPKPSEQKNELKELLPDYAEDLARHRHLTIQLLMSEEQIHSLLQSPPTPKPSEQKNELKELLPDYAEDLARHRHLTIQLLHEEYLKEHPNGYAYTQFKKHIRDYQYANTPPDHTVATRGISQGASQRLCVHAVQEAYP